MIDETQRSTAARVLTLLDLTDLTDDCRTAAIDALCRRAVTPYGKVAAVCIWPRFVTHASRQLSGSGVKVATVINFPHGGEDIERAVDDCRETLRDGADEVDVVMPYRAFMRGEVGLASEMIRAVAEEIPAGKVLKIILETGALQQPSMIAGASQLAIAAGANFLKTSTGKLAVSATPMAARIMLGEIRTSGKPVGFKAAGGIRGVAAAKTYLDLADEIMGSDWPRPQTFRFGASALIEAVVASLDGRVDDAKNGY